MKSIISVFASTIMLLLVTGCAVIINMRDGIARIDACPGVEFTLAVEQGPHRPAMRGTARGEVVRFDSHAFRSIDFSRSVTVEVFASTVPPDSECPIQAGVRYRLANVILPSVPGLSRIYQVDLSRFTRVP